MQKSFQIQGRTPLATYIIALNQAKRYRAFQNKEIERMEFNLLAITTLLSLSGWLVLQNSTAKINLEKSKMVPTFVLSW